MLARPLEIVQYTQQLADNAGLGSVSGRLLIAQRPLTVVGEVGLHALQIGGQLGDLVFGVRRIGRSRPSRHVAGRDVPHFTRLGIDPPLVSDGYLFARIAIRLLISVRHLASRPSSTTSASTTSSAEPGWAPPGSPPGWAAPVACDAA